MLGKETGKFHKHRKEISGQQYILHNETSLDNLNLEQNRNIVTPKAYAQLSKMEVKHPLTHRFVFHKHRQDLNLGPHSSLAHRLIR